MKHTNKKFYSNCQAQTHDTFRAVKGSFIATLCGIKNLLAVNIPVVIATIPTRQNIKILGLSDEEISERFGHLLEAFTFAPPPHGGIALGLDRLVTLLQGEANIREVIAFPKTDDAKDLMMGAPSSLPEKTIRDIHIKTI